MRAATAAGAVAVALAAAAPAAAQQPERDHGPRVRQEKVDGLRFKVLLPADYDSSERRYPVLYLIHPGGGNQDSWLERSDLVRFTERLPAIVVLPDRPLLAFLVDSRDGSCRGETQLMRGVIPHVDASYRTLAAGAHRAIAGASTGAFSATHLAARHPDAFAAVGAFGGDPSATVSAGSDRLGQLFFTPIERAAVLDCGGDPAGEGLFGHPTRDEVWLRDANPPDLAPNFGGMSVYASAGNSSPCDGHDVADLATESQGIPAFQIVEVYPWLATRDFVSALERAGVPHTADVDRCGLHSWRYWERDLHNFWPQMTAAFGRRAPERFDHRRAAPRFSAWGWTFTADRRRAREFLDVRGASRSGLTLRGSGLTRVATAPYFRPGRRVRVVAGGFARTLRAGDDGRLEFTVDLGPPHTEQQFRPENLAAEGDPAYFTTREVSLEPLSRRRRR